MIVAAHNVSRARLVRVPVRVGVDAAVLALGARERSEVAPGVDDHRRPLGRGAHVHHGEMGAVTEKQRGFLEGHALKRSAPFPAPPLHGRRKISARRAVVPHAPERQRVELCRGSVVEVRPWQLMVDFQQAAVGEAEVAGGSAAGQGSGSE